MGKPYFEKHNHKISVSFIIIIIIIGIQHNQINDTFLTVNFF